MLEVTPDIVVVSDLEGNIVYGNGALEQRVGKSLDELIGRHAGEVVHPEDVRDNADGWLELIKGKTASWEVALRFGSPETGWRWCLGSVGVDYETGLVIGTHQETSALKEAEERFRRAFEDAGTGMAITGLDGRFVRVNRSLAEMLGRAPEELAGRRVRELTHPDDYDGDAKAMRALVAGEVTIHRAEKR